MRADRLLNLLMLVQARQKLTAQQLADELGVSRRTILRDLDALSAAGVPIITQGGRGGGVFLDEAYQLALSGLPAAEIRTLFVSGFPSLLAELGLAETAERSLLKLFAALPALHKQAAAHVRQRIHIDPVWWWYESRLPFWEELQQAVYEDRCIRVVYERHSGEVVERVLEPYGLVVKAGIWYLVARRDGEFRNYRASRLHRVALLHQTFSRSPDFDLASFWAEQTEAAKAAMPSYSFTLRLPDERLPFLQYHVPGNSDIVTEPDGPGWTRARVTVSSAEIAQMLVFGIGAGVEVVEPVDLWRAVTEKARAFLRP